MKPRIQRADARDEFFTDERCHIVEVANTADDPDVSIARARVEPGVTTRWHRVVDTVERYVIVSGTGLVEIGDLAPCTMAVGDVAVIPAGCRQRITNVGAGDLVFLAICSPRFRQENYEDAEASTDADAGMPRPATG
jgi:mannose-6-phosphate isomerase-like protein (cupin superfamily)